MSSTWKDSQRLAALEAAAAVIEGHLGVIEGCRRLSSFAHDLVPDWRVDDDFVVFGAVDSETDALPVGAARQHWDQLALAREDKNIESAEATYKEAVVLACRNVLERFKDVPF
jgi:hypothetical protein